MVHREFNEYFTFTEMKESKNPNFVGAWCLKLKWGGGGG